MSTLFSRGRDMIARELPTVWVDETLTLSYRAAGDTYPTTASVHGKRGALDKRDLRVQMGLVAAGTITFLLQASGLTNPPRIRDKITDAAGTVYLIDHAALVNFDGSFWRCEVVKAT